MVFISFNAKDQHKKQAILLRLIVLFCLGCSTGCYGQYYFHDRKYFDNEFVFEVGVGAGGMNCLTDISGTKSKGGFYLNDFGLRNTRLNGSFHVGVLYQGIIGARLQTTYGSISAYDSIAKNTNGAAGQRYLGRNANFKSSIREVALIAEFYPLNIKFKPDGVSKLSPYLMVGVGWFAFTPQTNIKGQWIDLQPLRTEGQGFPEYKNREPYHLRQVNIPFGGGLSYELSSLFNLKAEFLHRVTFTDYLDDVSTTTIDPALFNKYLSPMRAAQARSVYNLAPISPRADLIRGDPRNNDSYLSLNLKLSIVLGRERR